MRVQIRVGNCEGKVLGLSSQGVIDALGRALSYVQDAAKYSFAVKSGRWDGRVRLLTKRLEFPVGLLATVVDILESYGVSADVFDERERIVNTQDKIKWGGPPLRDYQRDIVSKAIDEGRGMIKSCTGSGKSNCIAAIVAEYNVPTVVYVVSLDLLGQMAGTLEAALGQEIGVIGGGRCDIRKINVCSVWSAAKAFDLKVKNEEEDVVEDRWTPDKKERGSIKEVVCGARLVVLDEAQFAAAGSIQTLMHRSVSASHRFGFSGTPWRSDGADLLLTAAFGEQICDVKASDLIDLGWLVPPKIAFRDVGRLGDLGKTWAEVKKQYIVGNTERNKILIAGTKRLLDAGRRPLILFRDIAHGKRLEEMLPPDVRYRVVTGVLSLEDRDKIRTAFTNGELDLLLASSVYDQGVDLPALDALVLAGGGKSTAKALQRVGRVIRGYPGKKDALILETWDQAKFVMAHSLERYRAYKYEPRFVVSCQDAMKKAI